MARDTVLFDINETVLNLDLLKPEFKSAFGDETAITTWFAMLLQTSTVCALTKVETGFARLAAITLEALAARRGIELNDDQRAAILGGFSHLKPHADIMDALEKLRAAGYRTVAFSNSSLDLITRQIEHSGLTDMFDAIISVEATGSFKPDEKVYHYAGEYLERPVSDLRLVATHDWDTHGALNAGLKAAYINRTGTPYHPLYQRPTIVANSMHEIVDQIIREDSAQ